jgi:hypothetical protein
MTEHSNVCSGYAAASHFLDAVLCVGLANNILTRQYEGEGGFTLGCHAPAREMANTSEQNAVSPSIQHGLTPADLSADTTSI